MTSHLTMANPTDAVWFTISALIGVGYAITLVIQDWRTRRG